MLMRTILANPISHATKVDTVYSDWTLRQSWRSGHTGQRSAVTASTGSDSAGTLEVFWNWLCLIELSVWFAQGGVNEP